MAENFADRQSPAAGAAHRSNFSLGEHIAESVRAWSIAEQEIGFLPQVRREGPSVLCQESGKEAAGGGNYSIAAQDAGEGDDMLVAASNDLERVVTSAEE